MSLHKTLYCENCGAAEPLRGQQGDPTRTLYAVQVPLGVGKDHEDIFPLICMDCETYASFSLTADGLVELYDFALLTPDIHLAALSQANALGHAEILSKLKQITPSKFARTERVDPIQKPQAQAQEPLKSEKSRAPNRFFSFIKSFLNFVWECFLYGFYFSAIILILFVAWYLLKERPERARVQAAQTDLRTLSSALDIYRLDNFRYPSSSQGLEALVQKPTRSPYPKNYNPDGYIKKPIKDPWGHSYIYANVDDRIEVMSYGSDNMRGGEGHAADIRLSDLQ